MRRLVLAVFLAIWAAPSAAQTMCAPVGAALELTSGVPVKEPTGTVRAGGRALFALDTSLGMTGFIRNSSADPDGMIFADVVGAATRAFAHVRSEQLRSDPSTSDVYALHTATRMGSSELVSFGNITSVLSPPCTASISQRCGRRIGSSRTLAFTDGASIRDFFAALGNPTSGFAPLGGTPISPGDLVVIVTDLQNESPKDGAGELGQILRRIVESREVAIAVHPFRSRFEGVIYDLPGVSSLVLAKGEQPFMVIAVGGDQPVLAFSGAMVAEIGRAPVAGTAKSFEALVEEGRAKPPMIFRRSPPMPGFAAVRAAGKGQVQSDHRVEAMTLPVETGAGIEDRRILRVFVDREASADAPVLSLLLGTLEAPTEPDLWRFCVTAGAAELCPGAAQQTAIVQQRAWPMRPEFPDLLEKLEVKVREMIGIAQASSACSGPGWGEAIVGFDRSDANRTPFFSQVRMEPSGGGSELWLDVYLDPGRRGVLEINDLWLLEAEFDAVLEAQPVTPAWLNSGGGWHVDLTGLPRPPPIGIAGLQGFLRSLTAEPPPNEMTLVRGVLLQISD